MKQRRGHVHGAGGGAGTRRRRMRQSTGMVRPASAAGGERSTGRLSGELTFFAYEDAFEPALLDPFEEANPDLERQHGGVLER